MTQDQCAEFAASFCKLQVRDRHLEELQSTAVQLLGSRVVLQEESNNFGDFSNEILDILLR